LTMARMNKAAFKQLCSLLADIIITTLTTVDDCSNVPQATERKARFCHFSVQDHAGELQDL